MLANTLIIIGICLFFAAFFSGMEIAYLSANQLRMELMSKKGFITSRIFSFFFKHSSRFFTATLVGNNIAIVLYSIYTGVIITYLLNTYTSINPDHKNLILLIQTVASSFVLLIIGEFLPKVFFRARPNLMLNVLALPFMLFYFLLYPLVMIIVFLAQLILKSFFKMEFSPQSPEFTRHDLFHYVSESSPVEEEKEMDVDKEIFRNAIEFPFVKVRDCMTPRTDIVAIEQKDSIERAKELFVESGHSKIPVYRESIDHVTGYIHLVDLYGNPSKIEEIVMTILIATEAMPATELLRQFIEKHRSIALVVDEFGGTSGLITMEDIIEQIIGEIEDEHDVDDLVERKISDSEYVFSGRLEIDYLNEKYGFDLPDGDYETLGGLIFFVNQNIPKEGDIIIQAPFRFTIISADQARINEVKMKITTDV